jgi:hypothetical protein
MNKQFPEWQRMTILAVAGFIVALGLFSLRSAVANWTDFPSNQVVLLYFFVVLIVVPFLAVWGFLLAWQGRSPGQAAILTAIPAAILLLRAHFVGGV